MIHKIAIEPTKVGERGQYYRVWYDGTVLIEECRCPEYDACRALLAQGITGRLETYMGNAYPHMDLDIEEGAKWTVREDEHWPPTLVPYRQRPEVANENAISCDAEVA
jgi:hypothetical protein